MNLPHDTLRLWAQHREFRAVYAELARHSDRELQDMNLTHGDLARIAYAEAERRIVTPVPSTPKRAPGPPASWTSQAEIDRLI